MNIAEAQEVKHFLLQSHDQYRELAERHHVLDDRLHELTERSHLSETEQVEEATLKKRKLASRTEWNRSSSSGRATTKQRHRDAPGGAATRQRGCPRRRLRTGQ